jgi:hypothetical protein
MQDIGKTADQFSAEGDTGTQNSAVNACGPWRLRGIVLSIKLNAESETQMALHAPQQASVDWERLHTLFQRATQLEAGLRRDFILQETKNDPEIRSELLTLLACDVETDGGPLSRAVGSALVDVIHDQRRALLGRVVGSYKLASILGQGGTGTVYLGERADRQYSAQVAVKIVDHTAVQGNLGERYREAARCRRDGRGAALSRHGVRAWRDSGSLLRQRTPQPS